MIRGYSSRLNCSIQGLNRRRGYAGQGGNGRLGVHSHTIPECRFTVWEELVMGGGGGGGGRGGLTSTT